MSRGGREAQAAETRLRHFLARHPLGGKAAMGVFGWRERQDGVTLRGVVEGHDKATDGDWTLMVRPDPGSVGLLKNAHGQTNADGLVECEVEPSDFIESGPVQSWEPALFGHLMGKHVTVIGTWSDDLSHDDKTEIHPIVGLAAEETLGDTKFVQVFAFADDSGNSPATVPHSGVNRIAHLRVPFAPHPALPFHKVVPKFRIKNEWRHVKSRHFTVDESVSPPELDVFIETGVADDDQGFYFGSLVLDYDDTRMIIPYDVIPGSPRLRITHIETRNYRSTRGPTHQHYTSAIGGTDNGTFWKLRKDVAIHLIETNAKTFFTADAEGHESDVLVVQPHRDPHDEFFYPYLQTASDAFPGNNLSKLPKCPMYLDEVNP